MAPTDAGARRLPAPRARNLAGLLTAPLVLVATPTSAAPPEPVREFYIPAKPVSDALLDLALQGRVSLGGAVTRCRGVSPELRGRMTLTAALDRVLAGSNCTAVRGVGGAVIVRVRAAAALPVPRTSEPRPAPLSAQPAEVTSEVADVVVTAGRRPEAPQRLPSSLTGISGETLRDAGAADSADLAPLVAGMTVTNLGPGRNKILLRGASDGAFTGLTQSTVALYLDLAPITYSAPDPDLKLIDIDRVEVLRGPQGTLYGTGPLSGVVRIITERPDFEAWSLDANITHSRTQGGGGLNRDYSAIGNLPLLDGQAALRGSIYSETFSGYINDVNLALRRVNGGTRRGGRLEAAVRPIPGWIASLGAVQQRIKTEDTHYVYRGSGPLRRANLVREPHLNDFNEVFSTVSGSGGWGRFDGSVALVRHDFDSRYDASSALRRFGSLAATGALDEGKDIDLLVGEAVLASPDTGRFRWLLGAFGSRSTQVSDAAVVVIGTVERPIYAEARTDRLSEAAVFGEASLDLTDRLRLTGGLRYFDFGFETTSLVTQRAASRAFDGQGRTRGLSPKLALTYRLSDQVNLSAQISQGRRAPGFNTAGVIGQLFTGDFDTPPRRYEGDTLWNAEFGAKAAFADGRAQIRAAAFYARWSDIQSDQFLRSGLAYVVNVGDGVDKGLEIEAEYRPTDALELWANGLVSDAEVTRPNAAFSNARAAALPGVPRSSANAGLRYRRPVMGSIEAVADARLSYVGSARLTFDTENLHPFGDYMVGRISLGLEGEHWALSAFADNVFDATANTFAYSDPFRLVDAQATTPLRPRTIGVTLSLRAR